MLTHGKKCGLGLAVVALLVLLAPGAMAQTRAQEQQLAAAAGEASVFQFPVSFDDNLTRVPPVQLGAVAGGAVLGGLVLDVLLDGPVFTLAGILLGGLGGNYLYEQRYWPFNRADWW